MDITQFVQSLDMQAMQQNGFSVGALNRLAASGTSFADIILMMLSNTQTGEAIQGAQTSDYNSILEVLTENLTGNEEQYYPVVPQNVQSTLTDGLTDNSSDDDIKISDFSDNVISADPIQLSGLLGVIMTGSAIPQNNEILSTLYKEIPVNAESFSKSAVSAEDIINKYIDKGELEILGFTSGKTADAPVKNAQTNSANHAEYDEGFMDFQRTMKTAIETVPETIKASTADSSESGDVQANISSIENIALPLDIRFEKINSDIKMKEEFEAPEKQLLKGVEENLKNGKSEFTVKLKPEGLGEIIVKLVQNDGGKMLMSMTASSMKTAELLNSNLSSLQSSLSQHNVEIVNPSDMSPTVAAMTPAFEQYYGQNNGYRQNQQFYNRNQGYTVYSETDDAESFDEKAAAPLGSSGLDIMI